MKLLEKEDLVGFKVYLAGPMTGYKDYNFPAFMAAAHQLRLLGHEVFNPAEEDLKEWGTIENLRKNFNYRKTLQKDLNWICDHAEAICLLPGWGFSKGATAEFALAKALDLNILNYYEDSVPDSKMEPIEDEL